MMNFHSCVIVVTLRERAVNVGGIIEHLKRLNHTFKIICEPILMRQPLLEK